MAAGAEDETVVTLDAKINAHSLPPAPFKGMVKGMLLGHLHLDPARRLYLEAAICQLPQATPKHQLELYNAFSMP